ncbi:MAG: L,D-transpeptidase [Nitrospinae bacterium CG11_big_fil_rev_8_21_14_0_20_56_8]|nr:MAG: L,D-transpeptidase [Nitrospinae bacterium CG11_big_fil_rev_8_21_14_0_20_56_8]
MPPDERLRVLQITEYNLICNKNPNGNYDRKTRENLYWVIEKLRANCHRLSRLEERLYQKFSTATFGALEEKDKRVKFEVARYRLSAGVKTSLKVSAAVLLAVFFTGTLIYELVLDAPTRHRVDVAYYAGLNKVGLVSKEDLDQVKQNLEVTVNKLQETQQQNIELSQMVETMILNNKVTENFKYIVKQVYNDPRTVYFKSGNERVLQFNGQELARYQGDPKLWYLLGIIEKGKFRLYYNNEEIMEIEAIFGRKGDETPVGEYEIKNRAYKPTWYKREKVNGRTRVRAIPFGDPEHEIGHWWLGLKPLGEPPPGSYGIHGVNVNKVNEFYKKNFDWRSGSAGCPNVQDWNLEFLAEMVPLGTRVNIVEKDKWDRERPAFTPASAA